MKIKLFNGVQQIITLDIKAGGYDADTGKVQLVVVGDGGKAGTISLDLAEAKLLNSILTLSPKVETVVAKGEVKYAPAPIDPNDMMGTKQT